MTSGGSIDQVSVRLERVGSHLQTGDQLLAAGNEWASVAYFYAAYHLVRAAFLEDPIFGDPAGLTAANLYLQPADRDAEHHQGNPKNGGRSMGVKDMVLWLYRPYYAQYNRLHSASIAVRYNTGAPAIAATTSKGDAYTLHAAYMAGRLNHASAMC